MMGEENKLYFIPILIKAFESEESAEAIEKALKEIEELGEQEGFREGYKQFTQFLETTLDSGELYKEALIEKLLLGLASHSLDIDRDEQLKIIEKIKLNKNLYHRFKQLSKEHKPSIQLKIEIYKNENLIHSKEISPKNDELNFTNIEPSNYAIGLSNGRVLWSEDLEAKDLLIDKSEEIREYHLAAETDDFDDKPTRVIELIKDEIFLHVYSGLEFGKFKIIIK